MDEVTENFNGAFIKTFERNGIFTLVATATDAQGNVATDSVTFTIFDRSLFSGVQHVKNELTVSQIFIPRGEDFEGPDDLIVYLTVSNSGDFDNNNIRMSLAIPELGIWTRSRTFNLEPGDEISKIMRLPIDYAEPGIYDMRFVISNSHIRRVIHRELIIIK